MRLVERALGKHIGTFKSCFLKRQAEEPSLAGTMWLEIDLDVDGRVTGSRMEADSSLTDAGVRKCIQRSLTGITLPAPKGGAVSFRYPFMFSN
ncbi:AgmX/PglI C-terminal domain-containing protein [Myxococcota bacterium]|nr:AgmX/PglI C-terminal domain-containing protein [Myxococcota bacterium]